MDLIAVGEGLGTQLARRASFEVDLLCGAQRLQNAIETLPGPREQVAQLMDGDAIVVRGQTLIGSLELLPEALQGVVVGLSCRADGHEGRSGGSGR